MVKACLRIGLFVHWVITEWKHWTVVSPFGLFRRMLLLTLITYVDYKWTKIVAMALTLSLFPKGQQGDPLWLLVTYLGRRPNDLLGNFCLHVFCSNTQALVKHFRHLRQHLWFLIVRTTLPSNKKGKGGSPSYLAKHFFTTNSPRKGEMFCYKTVLGMT